jgi:hypothetical protein
MNVAHNSHEWQGKVAGVFPTQIIAAATIYKLVPEISKNDKRLVLQAVRHVMDCAFMPSPLEYASPELRKDFEVVLEAVRRSQNALREVDPTLRANKTTVLEVVRNGGANLQYAADSLRKDWGSGRGSSHMRWSRHNFCGWADEAIVLKAVKSDSSALMHVAYSMRSDEKVLTKAPYGTTRALFFHPLRHAAEDLKRNPSLVS